MPSGWPGSSCPAQRSRQPAPSLQPVAAWPAARQTLLTPPHRPVQPCLTHCTQRACAPSEPELSSLGEPSIRRTSVGRAPSSACLQIWLLSGPVGAVAVGMTTARPTVPASLPGAPLREQTSPGHRRAERTLTAGEGRPLGPGHFRTYPFLGLRIVPAD